MRFGAGFCLLLSMILIGLSILGERKDLSGELTIEELYFEGVFGARPFLLVDARSLREYNQSHIINSFSDEGCMNLKLLPLLRYKRTVLITDSSISADALERCKRKYLLSTEYRDAFRLWNSHGFPVERGPLRYRSFRRSCGSLGESETDCL